MYKYLTNPKIELLSDLKDDDDVDDDGIELTDEMIDAGLEAFSDADPRFMRKSSIVISIYLAMAAKAPVKP